MFKQINKKEISFKEVMLCIEGPRDPHISKDLSVEVNGQISWIQMEEVESIYDRSKDTSELSDSL